MDTKQFVSLIILGGLFYIGGQYIASQPQRSAQEADAKREITVQGRGEIHASPDIAHLTLGVITEPQTTAAEATQQLGDKLTKVTAEIKQMNIKDEDIKTTNVSVQPQYNFQDGRQVLRGYQAQENVEVKVRDVTKVGDIIARTTAQGANQIGDVQFTIDDPAALQLQAQQAAITDAKNNGQKLADALGVSLGRVKSFTTGNESTPPQPLYYSSGLGGGTATADVKSAVPPVPSGSQDVVATVTVTYELR